MDGGECSTACGAGLLPDDGEGLATCNKGKLVFKGLTCRQRFQIGTGSCDSICGSIGRTCSMDIWKDMTHATEICSDTWFGVPGSENHMWCPASGGEPDEPKCIQKGGNSDGERITWEDTFNDGSESWKPGSAPCVVADGRGFFIASPYERECTGKPNSGSWAQMCDCH